MDNFLARLLRPRRGSNPVSLWLRRKIEAIPVRPIIGIQLASAAFFSAIVLPQATDLASNVQAIRDTRDPVIVEAGPSEDKIQWPLTRFGITTPFSVFHPGMDLTDPSGTPIHPIADGHVVWVNFYSWGYGNHVLVEHDRGLKSLYAHLSKILVKPGDNVTKNTVIGQVGSTGWSSGNHLHLEIYEGGTPTNPLEVLPDLSQSPK